MQKKVLVYESIPGDKLFGKLVRINVSVDLKLELTAHGITASVDEKAEMLNSKFLFSWNFVQCFKMLD